MLSAETSLDVLDDPFWGDLFGLEIGGCVTLRGIYEIKGEL